MKHLKSFEQVTLPKDLTAASTDKTSTVKPRQAKGGKTTSFWEDVIDTFLPGTPIQDGYDIINQFDKIIKRRIENNKKQGLPLDKMSNEEIQFRTKLMNSTPYYGYPGLMDLLDIVDDVKSGRNVTQQTIDQYKKMTKTKKLWGWLSYSSDEKKFTEDEIKKFVARRGELKKMWFGLDDKKDDTKGHWVISQFRPTKEKDTTQVYYQPNPLPKLSKVIFNKLWNKVMATKDSKGNFPSGNSSQIFEDDGDLDHDLRRDLAWDLGHCTIGANVDKGKRYISFFDIWDLAPKEIEKFGIDVQKYGKAPQIYFRIYEP